MPVAEKLAEFAPTRTSQFEPLAAGPVCTMTLSLLLPMVNSMPSVCELTPKFTVYRPVFVSVTIDWATPLKALAAIVPVLPFTWAPRKPLFEWKPGDGSIEIHFVEGSHGSVTGFHDGKRQIAVAIRVAAGLRPRPAGRRPGNT